MRRLTSGEYAYTIRDLTGLDLKFDEFGTDSVGGEGFTNFGDVQFMADANLERYLEAAKKSPTMRSSARDRFSSSTILARAASNFRPSAVSTRFIAPTVSGGTRERVESLTGSTATRRPFTLRGFISTGRRSGNRKRHLPAIAAREGVSTRFAQHIWSVLHQTFAGIPQSQVVAKWRSLAPPSGRTGSKAWPPHESGSEEVMGVVVNWPRWLFAAGAAAEGGQGDERALVLNDAALQANPTHKFKFVLRGRGQKPSTVFLSTESANGASATEQTGGPLAQRDRSGSRQGQSRGTGTAAEERCRTKPRSHGLIRQGARRRSMKPEDFATSGSTSFQVKLPEGAFGAELQVEAELVPGGVRRYGSSLYPFRYRRGFERQAYRGALGDPAAPDIRSGKPAYWSSRKSCR